MTTLLFGSTTALEWEEPSGNQVPIPFDVNVSDLQGAEDVNFTLTDGDTSTGQTEITPDNGYASYEFPSGEVSSGEFTLNAVAYNGSNNITEDSVEIIADGTPPEIKFPDKQYVGDNPSINVKVSDDHSGPDANSYSASVDNSANVDNVDGFNSCIPGNDCDIDVEIGTDDLNTNAQFVLTIDAEDNVGNSVGSGENTKTFTYDGGYEADSPEIDGFDVSVESGVAEVNDDVDVDVNVPNIDDEISDAMQVECIADGDTVDTTDWGDSNSFECELPIEDIENQKVDVEVKACDRVNHCEKSDTRTVTFDAGDPEVDSFDTVEDYKVFGDDFEVEYEASDEATSIENVEYFFSSAFTEGEGYEVNAVDGSFTVDTSKLKGDSTERTVYIRVQDEAGRWSSLEEEAQVDFEFYPEAQPKVSLNAPSNFTVESGASKDLDIDVENPGKLTLTQINISLDSEIIKSSNTVESLEGGEAKEVSFELNPNETHLGSSQAEVSSDGPLDSETVTIQVNANKDQRENVDSKLENYSSKLEELNSNISNLKSEGLESSLNTSLRDNTSDFEETVVSAQNYVDEGKYHKAYNVLENVEEKYVKAEESFSEVKEQHELNKRNQKMMLAGLAVLMLSLGGVYYSRKSESDFDLSQIGIEAPENIDIPSPQGIELSVPDLSGVGTGSGSLAAGVSEKLENLKEMIQEEEEEVEKSFEGFR